MSVKYPLAHEIVHGKAKGTTRITLDEFKELYREVAQLAESQNHQLGRTYILLLTELALVQFSLSKELILRVSNNRPIRKNDFDIVITPIFEGNVKPIPWRAFIWTEIRHNFKILLPIFILFLYLLSQDELFTTTKVVNQMLIEANALFIGIFVLFTISQNRDLLASRELIKQGITHQLMQNDYYITCIAIISLILAFISTASISGVSNFLDDIVALPNADLLKNISYLPHLLTSISLVLLIDCLLAVTRYYLYVLGTAIEGQMYIELMSVKPSSDESKE